MRYYITVPGEVVAKQSARFAQIGGFIKSYQKANVTNYANFVKLCFLEQNKDFKLSEKEKCPLRLMIDIYKPIPSSKSKKFKEAALEGSIRPITKPDVDNCCKNILDGLNKIAYFDDSQIVDLYVRKIYSNEPRVEIIIEEI